MHLRWDKVENCRSRENEIKSKLFFFWEAVFPKWSMITSLYYLATSLETTCSPSRDLEIVFPILLKEVIMTKRERRERVENIYFKNSGLYLKGLKLARKIWTNEISSSPNETSCYIEKIRNLYIYLKNNRKEGQSYIIIPRAAKVWKTKKSSSCWMLNCWAAARHEYDIDDFPWEVLSAYTYM